MDSIAPVNTAISAALHTNDSTVDVTSITYDSLTTKYYAYSRVLPGQSGAGLTLADFGFESDPGFGYADFLNYVCSPAQIATLRLSYAIGFAKSF